MGQSNHIIACVDEIIFASGNNPRTVIPFRSGRGSELVEGTSNIHRKETKEKPTDFDSKDFILPIIVGGANASGKTSMLRAIDLICNLLQKEKISTDEVKEICLKIKIWVLNLFNYSLL